MVMNEPRTTILDRIILLVAGMAGGVGVGGVTGAVVGLVTALFGVGVNPATGFFGFGIGAAVGGFAGAVGGFLLAIVYMMTANRVVGALTGAVVGAFVSYYLNTDTFIGDFGVIFLLTSVLAGAAAGYTMIAIFQRMDASVNKSG